MLYWWAYLSIHEQTLISCNIINSPSSLTSQVDSMHMMQDGLLEGPVAVLNRNLPTLARGFWLPLEPASESYYATVVFAKASDVLLSSNLKKKPPTGCPQQTSNAQQTYDFYDICTHRTPETPCYLSLHIQPCKVSVACIMT